MKQVMQEHQKTGILHADVSSGVAGMPGPCHIEIQLLAGTIVSCAIVDSYGQRLSEKESLKRISRLGTLLWTFESRMNSTQPRLPAVTPSTPPAFTPPALPVFTPSKLSLFPCRTVQLTQEQMRSWSRIHRGIFALADGTRSVAKITEILSAPPDLIDRALRDLQSIGVIALELFDGRSSR